MSKQALNAIKITLDHARQKNLEPEVIWHLVQLISPEIDADDFECLCIEVINDLAVEVSRETY